MGLIVMVSEGFGHGLHGVIRIRPWTSYVWYEKDFVTDVIAMMSEGLSHGCHSYDVIRISPWMS